MSQKTEYFGKYILLEKIAAGGMAEVFLARAPGAGGIAKYVAIKRILPQYSDNKEFVDMFKDEAKIAINLTHSNIVSIYEFGIESGQFFLVMEYVKGKNIRQILNKIKQTNMSLSVDQIVYVCKEIAGGLDHAHRCIDGATGKPLNITHRDMSPQNVMVSFEGEIRIIDFGIAKAESQMETTRAGTLKGKFGYMSPEQAEGQNVDLRTDIFSLGTVLWELLANDRLFIANNEINTLRKIRDCHIPSLTKINPEVHPELERIVLKALTKDRNLRYQTAAAFHRDLSRFLNRHYPDFSSQDFSMFVKSLYADEILDLNNKLVEYSQVPFKAGGQTFSAEDLADKTMVMKDDDTVTETNPSKADSNHLSKSIPKLNLTFGKKTASPPPEKTINNSEPITLTNSTESQSSQADSSQVNELNIQSTKSENSELLNNKNLAPDGLILNEKTEKNRNTNPHISKGLPTHSFTKTTGTLSTEITTSSARPAPSSPNGFNKSSGTSPFLTSHMSPPKPSIFKKMMSVVIYSAIAIFSYLFLTTLLPRQMQPLMVFVSDNLKEFHLCESLNDSGTLNVLTDFGFNKEALCSHPQVIVDNPTDPQNPLEPINPQVPVDIDPGKTTMNSETEPVNININSEPSGAAIYINGEYQNRSTPSLMTFKPGETVVLELRKKDYKSFTTEHFDPNFLKTKTFKARLEKIEYGFISIDVKPPQFPDVYINGKKISKPLPIDRYPIPALQETEIIVRNPISKQLEKRKVFLSAGEKKSMVIFLQRQPAGSR
ncbi:MAG: serine/threonine protein kinase [Bdellovibrionaceae bacterium]|nr:serine/threonine protein kinase [Pseudobdellovibrionaceae bacterium]